MFSFDAFANNMSGGGGNGLKRRNSVTQEVDKQLEHQWVPTMTYTTVTDSSGFIQDKGSASAAKVSDEVA